MSSSTLDRPTTADVTTASATTASAKRIETFATARARRLGRRRLARAGAWCGPVAGVARVARTHAAQTVIREAQPPLAYSFEVQPHLILGTAPGGPGAGSGTGLGALAVVEVSPDGFIGDVNDSIAVGAGLGFGHHTGAWLSSGQRDQCLHFEPGPAGTSVCTEVTSGGGGYNYVYVPLVMQWNVWLTQQWSVFAEPGLDLYLRTAPGSALGPAMHVGGRFKIADRMTLTARVGYPNFTFGVSFFL